MDLPLTDIEQRVMAAIQELDVRWETIQTGNAPWTNAVKNAIGNIGKKLGFRVYASQSDFEENGEWVYDLVWCIEDNGMVLDIPLVMESEWNPYGCLDDFQKLLVSRASQRVMVLWQPNHKAWKRCLDQFTTQICRYRGTQRSDRYFFLLLGRKLQFC